MARKLLNSDSMPTQESVTVTVKGHPVILDKDFAEDFDPAQWQCVRFKRGKYHYVGIQGPRSNGRKRLWLHRLLAQPKATEHVDHINGNTLDNRLCNLRTCSRGENARNRKPRHDSKSGIKGVYFRPRFDRWVVDIGVTINGKFSRKHLGHFLTKEEATLAYDQAARKYHGEFARTNSLSC